MPSQGTCWKEATGCSVTSVSAFYNNNKNNNNNNNNSKIINDSFLLVDKYPLGIGNGCYALVSHCWLVVAHLLWNINDYFKQSCIISEPLDYEWLNVVPIWISLFLGRCLTAKIRLVRFKQLEDNLFRGCAPQLRNRDNHHGFKWLTQHPRIPRFQTWKSTG